MVKISKIRKIKNNSYRYDLQTKKHNNFFANGMLVHNSLIILYPFNNEWMVATSGTADASATLPMLKNTTFEKLFWNVWKDLNYNLPKQNNLCYAFEFMTPYNRVVVQYKENNIVLLGSRNLDTQQELDPRIVAKDNGWKCVEHFGLSNIDDIIKSCEKIQAIDGEGYIVRDKNFNRIKVKTPQYVAMHYLRSTISTKRLLEIIMLNESEEFLTYFEEFRPVYNIIKARYDEFLKNLQEIYDEYRHIESQKEFALTIDKFKGHHLLFTLRNKRASTLKEAFSKLFLKRAHELLNLDDIDEKLFEVET